MQKPTLSLISAVLAVLVLTPAARAATDALPNVEPPVGFAEGTETQMTADQMSEILPWATTTETALNDLLETATSLSYAEARDTLLRGIQDVVLASAPKRTELLTRYILNRALLVNTEIESQADTSQLGVIDMQVRLLKLSAQLAKKYYASDLAYLNGRFVEKRTDLAGLPYAIFGLEYAHFLMSIDQSLFDASAQYNVAIQALGLLQWDLYRDQDRLLLAPVISKINRFLKMAPQRATSSDSETVKWVRKAKKTYLSATAQATELLKQARRVTNKPALPPGLNGKYRVMGSIEATNYEFQVNDSIDAFNECLKVYDQTRLGQADEMTVSVNLSAPQRFTTPGYWYTPMQACYRLSEAARAMGVPAGSPSAPIFLVSIESRHDMALQGRTRTEIFDSCVTKYNEMSLAGSAVDEIFVTPYLGEAKKLYNSGGYWRTANEVCLQIVSVVPS